MAHNEKRLLAKSPLDPAEGLPSPGQSNFCRLHWRIWNGIRSQTRVFMNRTALLCHCRYLCRFKRKLNKIRLSPFRFTSCRHVAVLVCRRFVHRPWSVGFVLGSVLDTRF